MKRQVSTQTKILENMQLVIDIDEFIYGLSWGWIMVFNATFNNISVISWLSV
jgi:hypothetical protein